MPQWVIASVFGALALCAAWGIYSSYSTGTVYGELSQYSEDREPTAFFMIVLGKVLALIFCLAIAMPSAYRPWTLLRRLSRCFHGCQPPRASRNLTPSFDERGSNRQSFCIGDGGGLGALARGGCSALQSLGSDM
jgi:hypothetical protein